MSRLRVIGLAMAVAALLGTGVYLASCGHGRRESLGVDLDALGLRPSAGVRPVDTRAGSPNEVRQPPTFAELLRARGWTDSAARAYERFNAALLTEIRSSNPRGWELLADRLARLSQMRGHVSVLREVEEAPELASLLAWSPSPEVVYEAWCTNIGQRRVLLNILLFQNESDRLVPLASAWKRHGRSISDCWRVGLIGAEAIFLSGRRDEGDDEYDRWLGDLFGASSFESPDKLAARLVLVLDQGADLRARLRLDPSLRQSFRAVLWPRLEVVTSRVNRPLDLFVRHHHIWDLLARPDGVELASTYGAIPVDLLFGDAAYSADVHGRIVSLLKRRNRVTVTALMDPRLRRDDRFRDLLRRPIPDVTLLRVFDDLLKAGDGVEELLAQLYRDDPEAIVSRYKEVIDLERWDDSLPSYAKVPRRWFAGEPLDDHDIPTLAVDTVFDLLGVAAEYVGPAFGVPTDSAAPVLDGLQGGIDEALQGATQRKKTEQLEQIERVQQTTSRAESRKMIDDSLLVDAAIRSLAGVQKMTAAGADPTGETAWRTLKFFYSTSVPTAAAVRAFENEGLALRFTDSGLLFAVPKDRASEPYAGRGREEWARAASRRWLIHMLNDQ